MPMDAALSSHRSSRFPLAPREHSRHLPGHLPALVTGLCPGQQLPAATHEGRRWHRKVPGLCGSTTETSASGVPAGRAGRTCPAPAPAPAGPALRHCPGLGMQELSVELTESPSHPLTDLCPMRLLLPAPACSTDPHLCLLWFLLGY